MTTIKYPFRISGGRVVMAQDGDQEIRSNVTFCLATQAGERVMNPSWGINILNANYAMGATIEAAVDEAIRDAFRAWFPKYEIRKIKVTPFIENPTYVEVDVYWGQYGSTLDTVSKVGVQVPGGGEMFNGEGH